MHALPPQKAVDDERGSALVILLVMITVIAVTATMVLNQQSNGFAAQKVYTDRGVSDAAADSALSTAIAALRYNPFRGSVEYAGLGGPSCSGSKTSTVTDSTVTAADYQPFKTYTDAPPPSGSGATYVVQCAATNTSGLQSGSLPDVPPGATILTLGGYHGTTKYDAGQCGGSVPCWANGKGDTYGTTSDDNIPYCYDDGDDGTPGCEAGMYVGPGVSSDTGGGMLVSSDGALGNPPVIQNNSDVAIRTSRTLQIATPGVASMRGKCSTWTHVGTTAGNVVSYPGPAPAGGVCQDDQWNRWFVADPRYSHRDTSGLVNRDSDVTRMYTNVSSGLPNVYGQSGCAYYNNTFIFRPGIYTTSATFNSLSNLCSGLFWFIPGAYYFDFTYTAADHGMWNTPPRGTNGGSQVVGGNPPATNGWRPPDKVVFGAGASNTIVNNAGGSNTWDITNGWSANIAQTYKTLVPTANNTPSAWSDTTTLVNSYSIDGQGSATTNGGTAGKLQLKNWQTPVPLDATGINNVQLDLNYMMSSAWDANGTQTFAKDFPRIELVMPQSGYAACDLVLPPKSSLVSGGNPAPLQNVDIQAACAATDHDGSPYDPSNTTNGNIKSGTGVWVPHGTNNPQWKANGHVFQPGDWTPTLVNTMTAEWQTKGTSSASAAFSADGLLLHLNYTGRPAPSYPGGCSNATGNGVQFILGGWTHINWSGQNAFIELCGSKSGSPTEDDPYGIAVYGVGQWQDRTAGAQTVWGATPVTTATRTDAQLSGLPGTGTRVNFYNAGTQFGYYKNGSYYDLTNTNLGASPPAAWAAKMSSLFGAKGDGNYAELDIAPSGSGFVNVTLPNDLVPAGAYVDMLEVKVRHAETGSFQNIQFSLNAPSGSTGAWNSAANGNLPACEQPTSNNDLATWQDWTVGNYYKNDDDAAAVPDEYDTSAACNTATPPNPLRWAYGSKLLRAFQNPDGTMTTNSASKINGAILSLEWDGNGPGGGADNFARIDAVSVTVQYRPLSSGGSCSTNCAVVRPLRGCLTERTATNPADSSTGDPRAIGGGSDWDYAATMTSGAPTPDPDYEAPSASGNGGNTDNSACALLYFDRNERFHISGSLYAPTAALDIRGDDNQTSFISTQTVVRQLSTYRWKTGETLSAFGQNGNVSYQDREVYLRVYNAADMSTPLAEEKVKISDHNGPALAIGNAVQIVWYKRRGET